MPQMGESIFEGTITKWLKKVGDSVQRDEPLFEISTDKVDAEIPSPASGTLSAIKVEAGNTVQINTVVAVIGGGAAKATAPAAAASTPSTASNATAARRQPLPLPHPSRQLRHRMASGCAHRRWCAKLRRNISSIFARFQVPDRAGASPRTTFCSTSKRVGRRRLQQPRQLPHKRLQCRSLLLHLYQPQLAHNRVSWCRSHACARSSRSAWWIRSAPARTCTLSSRWT